MPLSCSKQSEAAWRNWRRFGMLAVLFLLNGFLLNGAGVGAICVCAQQTQDTPQKTGAVESPAAPKGTKLILKDGSFQVVRKYEVKGDRVRFYSIERSAWEEVPASMVDWDATRHEEAAEARRRKETLAKLHNAIVAERAASIDVDASVEVGPGLFLPPGEGLFILDDKAVVPLPQSEAQTKLDKKRLVAQVMVPVPIVPSRSTVFLPGQHSKFRITNTQPEFYMRTADTHEPQIELIRAKVKGNARTVQFIDTYIVEKSTKADDVPIQQWKVAKGVFRFTIGKSLEPGEYTLAEITPDKGMSLFVWDFGVDAKKQ